MDRLPSLRAAPMSTREEPRAWPSAGRNQMQIGPPPERLAGRDLATSLRIVHWTAQRRICGVRLELSIPAARTMCLRLCFFSLTHMAGAWDPAPCQKGLLWLILFLSVSTLCCLHLSLVRMTEAWVTWALLAIPLRPQWGVQRAPKSRCSCRICLTVR